VEVALSRRPALLIALGCLLAAPLSPAAAAPTEVQASPEVQVDARSGALLRASAANVMPGERLTITAGRPRGKGFTSLKARDKKRARLVLQKRRPDGTWRKVRVRKFEDKKRLTFSLRALSGDTGFVRLRTIAKVNGRVFGGARLRVPVVKPALVSQPTRLATRTNVTFKTTFSPARHGRPVSLQAYENGAWKSLGEATTDALGQAALAVDAPAHPVWYRVVTPEWNGTGAMATEPVRTALDRVPTVIAHRAGAGAAPEQTIAAVRQALAAGAPAMEIDVQLSKDGVPVIVHDRTLARTTNVEEVFPDRAPWNLADFTLAEIKQLDAGSWFGPQFSGEQIPTLDEVLAEINGRAHLVVEVKSPGDPGNAGIAQALTDELAGGLLGQAAAARKLTFSSFDVAWLQAFATAHPEVPVGVLSTPNPTISQLDAWQVWAEEIHPQYILATKATIDAARARGLGSSVWTVNETSGFQRALDLGADQIITDFPGRLAAVVDPPMPPH
jgi:glycerophosphoryl diester phosphodiesterase